MERHTMGPSDMAWFTSVEKGMGSGGSLVYNKENYND